MFLSRSNILQLLFLQQQFCRISFCSRMGQPASLVSKEDTIPDRTVKMAVSPIHAVNKNTMVEPFPDHLKFAMFGMGCFWGAEKKFWKTKGVFSTQVGYSGGITENPTYKDICSGRTNHNEVVQLQFDPSIVSYTDLLKVFWENHNPTQGMRQGNDHGTQYRSSIYCYGEEQLTEAKASKKLYQEQLTKKGYPEITTEILPASNFYYAEDHHQQYLHKNPNGYCGLGGTGVSCPKTEL